MKSMEFCSVQGVNLVEAERSGCLVLHGDGDSVLISSLHCFVEPERLFSLVHRSDSAVYLLVW